MEESANNKKAKGGGAPLWMATFADLMSLLLAFFVLLFSFSSTDDKLFVEVGGSLRDAFGVERFSRDSWKLGISHISLSYSGGRPGMSLFTFSLQEAQKSLDKHLAVNQPESGGVTNKFERNEQLLAALLIEVKKKLVKETLGEDFSEEGVNLSLTPKAISITIEERVSFASGSDELQSNIVPLIDKIATLTKELEGSAEITGHTDDQPISSRKFRSNWELSLRRATAIAKKLESSGKVGSDKINTWGRDSQEPLADNDTPAGRAKNRRVEIKITHGNLLEKIDKEITKIKKYKKPVKKWNLPSIFKYAPVINKLLFTKVEY